MRKPLIGCTTYRMQSKNGSMPLYALRPAYVNAVRAAGGVPILIPLGLTEEELQTIFTQIDGLLLPGGGDVEPAHYQGQNDHETIGGVDTDRDRIEFELARWSVAQEKPVLAVCRGLQVFNVALGGTLWEDVYSQMTDALFHSYVNIKPREYIAHAVEMQAGSRLAQQMGVQMMQVNSLHHQGIRDLAAGVTAVAHAPDGLIEGIEIPDHPYAIGVQWHPEDLAPTTPAMQALFDGLVQAARDNNQ
ncbi:MAG: gamma-glutamyl-gamma-aminobutyrate hydrolase family protein [Ardenticatenaceae bacterium]|nr:gamma-glutamyl-gamma-aminobutyrate hydrolase family protein [Anaerolineales bacterium]MCB8921110.1 gamma-glutamyl-gamma-aminobutyrate hydrolase family protein [Ardenticatenaceae bacterium]MCB8990815.1 gamma-glutamyl-gamma-aminobutyrate hydrolase family protein [Ardenticatenaceae bacterium]MCB9004491.1 gamma-glutamyl-gamma-aminobutyrate hydrolase family protein [Ardenticatenaceae bacterium]